jgi:hypothetical protein
MVYVVILALFVILWEAPAVFSPMWKLQRRTMFLGLDGKRRVVFILSRALLILLAVLMVRTPWSLRGILGDAILLTVAYFAYADLVFAFSAFSPRLVTWPASASGFLFIGLGLVCGMLFLGAELPASEIIPSQSADLGGNYAYRVALHGSPAADRGGARVKVLYRPPWLPVVEKQVFAKNYGDSECRFDAITVSRMSDSSIAIRCPQEEGGSIVDVVSTR